MKLTSRSEYALLALVYLARCYSRGLASVKTIAGAQNIPPKFLEHILLLLKRSGYLRSLKGQYGGYALIKPPSQVNLAEVIRLLEGPIAPTGSVSKYFYEHTPIEKEKKLVKIFKESI